MLIRNDRAKCGLERFFCGLSKNVFGSSVKKTINNYIVHNGLNGEYIMKVNIYVICVMSLVCVMYFMTD